MNIKSVKKSKMEKIIIPKEYESKYEPKIEKILLSKQKERSIPFHHSSTEEISDDFIREYGEKIGTRTKQKKTEVI